MPVGTTVAVDVTLIPFRLLLALMVVVVAAAVPGSRRRVRDRVLTSIAAVRYWKSSRSMSPHPSVVAVDSNGV